jgi:chemotaxis protein CheZ
MLNDPDMKAQMLAKARELVASIEADDEDAVSRLIDDLGKNRESDLFVELGKLTRELHDSLNSFRLDSRISELAEREIPDAKERLNYVVTLTEQAAHRTLNAVEGMLPISEALEQRAGGLGEEWQRFRSRDMSAEEFRSLSRQIEEFLSQVGDDARALHRSLSEVLMAQDFQDLTGQVIRRVIRLVQDVEENLVRLIRITGERFVQAERKDEKEQEKESNRQGIGPAVPGVDAGGVVSGQDEVDDLLSSLGF